MGVVYKAQDTRLKRLVALKFLPPELTRDADTKLRFVQEAEAASALDDPHVCTIYDIDATADGRVFIAMAYYDGETLKKRIQRGPLPIEDVISISGQIARGLAAAHEAGIVHRDIKPANLMITTRGEVKIVDFGIAKLSGQADLTGTGLSLGTVAYMAPEQFQGQVDRRADLWALGVVLYEMLTGRRPFEGENDLALMNAVLNTTPQRVTALRADVPEAMAAVVDQALQKEPFRRLASAGDMASAIEACRVQSGAPATNDDTGAILRTLRRPLVAFPAVAVVGALGYVLVTTLVDQSRQRWAREEAIPEIRVLLQQDEIDKAYALAQDAGRYIPSDPMLVELLSQITQVPALTTKPEGASVYVKPVPGRRRWSGRLVGTTPLRASDWRAAPTGGASKPMGSRRTSSRETWATSWCLRRSP